MRPLCKKIVKIKVQLILTALSSANKNLPNYRVLIPFPPITAELENIPKRQT